MKLTLAVSFCTVAAAVALPQHQQQLTFSPSFPGPALLSLNPDLVARLSSLPAAHVDQLAQHVAQLSEERLIQLNEDGGLVEVTEGEKALLVFQGIKFRDVTDDRTVAAAVQRSNPYPTKFKHSAHSLNSTFAHLDIEEMKTFLGQFSGFYTRYYRSPQGKESQKFLLKYLTEIHKKSNKKSNVTITEFEHSWGQNSILVRMEPKNESKADDAVVIMSAHQDSTNSLPFLRAPGADDDGSGTTVLLSVFRALLLEGFVPTTNPVEFHFYSAEEGGMLGSGEVSRSYAEQGRKVRAVYHTDVVAFVKEGTEPRIGVISDNVDPELTEFMRRVIDEFAELDYVNTKCGYACSDHSSWVKIGFPASCLSEGRFEDSNTRMHSAGDTMDQPEFDWEHVKQFGRVGIAVGVELGGMERV